MPSEAAKKARMCFTKYRSSSFSLSFQSTRSAARSISSAVQKLASDFLVETPDVVVFDGEKNEPVWIVFEDWLCDDCVLRENFFDGSLDFGCFNLVFGGLVHFYFCVLHLGW